MQFVMGRGRRTMIICQLLLVCLREREMYPSRLLLAPLVQGCRCRAATLVAANHAAPPRWRALEASPPRHISCGPAASGHRGRGANWGTLLLGAAAGVIGFGLARHWRDGGGGNLLPQVQAAGEKSAADEEMKSKVSRREIRYKDFASYVYKGEPYMSARDFLDAVTRDGPRSE